MILSEICSPRVLFTNINKRVFLLFIFCFLPFFLFSQLIINDTLFKSPLDIPLKLAGSFGEIRSGHFHSGIDIRTQGKEGLPVKAAASGHISRIKVSSVGFGKVIYMDHPEGYTSVYAHLYSFNDALSRFIDSAEFANHSFEVELFPDSSRFVYKQGDLLGLSGNSGGSEAPHLHFEIRDRKSEEPMNPKLFGLEVKDTIKPLLQDIYFYSLSDSIWKPVNTSFSNDTVIVSGCSDTLGIAFESTDPDSAASLGIYSLELKQEDSVIYKYAFNRFSFNESKFVNAHIDYELKSKLKITAERCYRLPNDSCSVYREAGKGIILLNDTATGKITISIKDFKGNLTSKTFFLRKENVAVSGTSSSITIIDFKKPYTYKEKDFEIQIPSYSLFQNAEWTFTENKFPKQESKKFLSPNYVFCKGIPFVKSVLLKKKINTTLSGKVVLAELNGRNEIGGASVCKQEKDIFTASVKSGGSYAFTVDTVAPVIKMISYQSDPVTLLPVLFACIIDNMTSIKSYNVYVNNEWTLSGWDPRSGQLFIYPREESYGPFKLKIEVSDSCNNTSVIETGF